MISRLYHRFQCRRGRHDWDVWVNYFDWSTTNVLQRGEFRVCWHCPETQYRNVTWDAIPVGHETTGEWEP